MHHLLNIPKENPHLVSHMISHLFPFPNLHPQIGPALSHQVAEAAGQWGTALNTESPGCWMNYGGVHMLGCEWRIQCLNMFFSFFLGGRRSYYFLDVLRGLCCGYTVTVEKTDVDGDICIYSLAVIYTEAERIGFIGKVTS